MSGRQGRVDRQGPSPTGLGPQRRFWPGRRWAGLVLGLCLLGWVTAAAEPRTGGQQVAAPGQPTPGVRLFVKTACPPCRAQARVLTALGLPFETVNVSRSPEARRALATVLGGEGLGDSLERLPVVTVGQQVLTDDPSVAMLRAHLPPGAADWSPPGGDQRVQWFHGSDSAVCPGVTEALTAAGVSVERNVVASPGVEERMWVALRLRGRRPRHGISLPVMLVGDRVLTGCPPLGVLARALPSPALAAAARAEVWADPDGFAVATLRALSTLRDRPRLGLSRLLVAPGLLSREAWQAGQLTFAERRRPLQRRPWGTLIGEPVVVLDPLSPAEAALQLLATSAEAWSPEGTAAAARLIEGPDGRPMLEAVFAPAP